jgi:hypothetical protein
MKAILAITLAILIAGSYAFCVYPYFLFCKAALSLPKEAQEEFVCSVAKALIESKP